MKRTNKRVVIALAVVLALVLTACGGGGGGGGGASPAASGGGGGGAAAPAQVVVLTFANVSTEAAKLGGEKFKEIAEAESGGTLRIDLFPDNQLGDDRTVYESTIFGDIDIAVSSTSPLATMYADFFVFDAPFLFIDKDHAISALNGSGGQGILEGLSDIGLKGLVWWENGFRNFTTNIRPVSTPADVAGMKVRTMENPLHLAAWTAYGANPTPMAFTELFTALQQGTVDAMENPLGIIDGSKFQEIQQYISLTQHVFTPFIVSMNLDRYNSLTDAQKAAIDKAAAESGRYQWEMSTQIEQKILDSFAADGVTVIHPTHEDKAKFQDLVAQNNVLDLVRERMDNPALLDQLQTR